MEDHLPEDASLADIVGRIPVTRLPDTGNSVFSALDGKGIILPFLYFFFIHTIETGCLFLLSSGVAVVGTRFIRA